MLRQSAHATFFPDPNSPSLQPPRIVYQPISIKEFVNAARSGNMRIVQNYIYEHKTEYADMNAKYENVTALCAAVEASQTAVILELLNQGKTDITLTNSEWESPLHIAARIGNIEIVNALLQRDKQLDRTTATLLQFNMKGESPLFLAASHDHADTVKTLIDAGAIIVNIERFIGGLKAKGVSIKTIKLIIDKHNNDLRRAAPGFTKSGN